MKGVNQATIIGTLGRDPETKTFQNGCSITSFSVAVNESWNDKNTGEKKEHTEWLNIVANGKLAEICAQYLKKGSKVYLCGKIKTRKWQSQDGSDKYTTEIHIQDMQMLDSKPDTGAQGGGYAPQPAQQRTPAPQRQQQAPQAQSRQAVDFDDDIPF